MNECLNLQKGYFFDAHVLALQHTALRTSMMNNSGVYLLPFGIFCLLFH